MLTIYSSDAGFHFYTDEMAMYCSSSLVEQTFEFLQSAFHIQYKLVFNADKLKAMQFSNGKKLPTPNCEIKMV